MTGKNSKLAEEVDRVLREHGKPGRRLSLRQAGFRTGVGYSTIENMLLGSPAIKPENLVRFALGFGENPKDWLKLCGYDEDWHDPILGGDADPDVQEVVRLFMQIPREKRPHALQALTSIIALAA